MHPITVLVADDEPEIADLIGLLLEKEGYRIIKAANGKEAVEAVRTHAVDLAVLDIMMPDMDGYEAIRKIRETTPLPVIFVSAKSSDMD